MIIRGTQMVIIEMSAYERLIKQAIQELNAQGKPINHRTLAARAGCSVRTVERIMPKLQRHGEMIKEGSARNGYVYRLRHLG